MPPAISTTWPALSTSSKLLRGSLIFSVWPTFIASKKYFEPPRLCASKLDADCVAPGLALGHRQRVGALDAVWQMNIDVSARLGRRQDRSVHQGEFEQMRIARRIANGDQAHVKQGDQQKLPFTNRANVGHDTDRRQPRLTFSGPRSLNFWSHDLI